MGQIQYYVDEAKGVVIAKIPNIKQAIYDEAVVTWNKESVKARSYGTTPLIEPIMTTIEEWIKVTTRPDFVVGKAKCNFEEGDTFDLEFGKKLAMYRVAEKLASVKSEFYEFMNARIMDIHAAYLKRLESNQQHIIAQKDSILKLLGR